MCTDCNELEIPIESSAQFIADFITVENQALSSNYDFLYTVTVGGTYVLQMELYIANGDADGLEVRSNLRKSGVAQSSNVNYQHDSQMITTDSTESVPFITYTHSAKIIAVAADTIGFRLNANSNLTIRNGSISVFKIA